MTFKISTNKTNNNNNKQSTAGTARKIEKKTADKVVAKLEKAERRGKRNEALDRVVTKGGRLTQRKQYSQSLALARYMAMLCDPCPENCCRAPEVSTMRETFVFCLKESGIVRSSAAGKVQFFINNDPRSILSSFDGNYTFGVNQPNSWGGIEFMFTNFLQVRDLAKVGRLNAIRYRLRSIMNAYDVKGFWADAPVPNDGSVSPSNYTVASASTLPNSLVGNVVANAEISAFLLPAGNAGEVSTPGSGDVPMEFTNPFQWRYFEGAYSLVNTHENDSYGSRHVFVCEGLPVSVPVFQLEIEACYEVQPENQILLQVAATGSLRPPPGSEEAVDDVMEHLRPEVAGQVPLASSGPAGLGGAPPLAVGASQGPSSRVDPTKVVSALADKASGGADMTGSTLGMIDDLMPSLGDVASHAFDLATEYGPDLLTAVGGLIPGGADASLALKYGGKALKWLTGK